MIQRSCAVQYSPVESLGTGQGRNVARSMLYRRQGKLKIPECPNHKQSTSICAESRLRLLGETETSFLFTCNCCGLLWSVSKPNTKAAARWENQCRRVQQATEIERQRASRKAYSLPSK